MKKVTLIIGLLAATVIASLTGCSTMESIVSIPKTLIADPFMEGFNGGKQSDYKAGNFDLGGKNKPNTTYTACVNGKAVYNENLDSYKQTIVSFSGDTLMLTNRSETYYMNPSVLFMFDKNTDKTDIYMIDDSARTTDRFSFKSLYEANKKNYEAICGEKRISSMKNEDASIIVGVARGLAFRMDKKVENSLNRDYTAYPGFQAIYQKHIPGYSTGKHHVADPAATIAYLQQNNDKLAALEAELEAYFLSGGYKADKEKK